MSLNLAKPRNLPSLFKGLITFEHTLTAIFFILGLIGINHHEIWRDEFQAWLIARDSQSILELLTHIGNEGHPGLWHLCLYGLSHLTHNPFAMQLFHLLIAAGTVYLFAKYSPFTTAQKTLFAFGYFPFFEYAIISRNYGLGILFTFLCCTFFSSRSKRLLPIAVILALLANTSPYGLIFSFIFWLILLFNQIDGFSHLRHFSSLINRSFISASGFVFTSWIIAVLQMIPALRNKPVVRPVEAVQTHLPTTHPLLEESIRMGRAFTTIWKSYVPLPNFFQYDFWNTNILSEKISFLPTIGGEVGSASDILSFLFSAALFLIAVKILIKKPLILFIYLTGSFALVLFSYLIFFGALRHHGHLFIWFLTCLWLSKSIPSKTSNNLSNESGRFGDRFAKKFLTVLLLIHAVSGIFAYRMDLVHPFSMSQATASYIKTHNLANLVTIGTRDKEVTAIAGYLDKEIYYPEIERFSSFWGRRRRELLDNQRLFQAIEKLASSDETQILLILTNELDSSPADIKVEKVAHFQGGIVSAEKYYLYLANKIRVNT
ncbi:hypothetical protein [Sphaerothrix gracilis]|uniref:hypothetical protein n=1 Tax=Sphaerothrix gracilis TaxID=3151835 RepID=UPI0031FC6DEE